MDTKITVRHTANAGILIKTEKESIGVDIFSRDPNGLYPDTPEDLREELMKAIERREIGTLIFTHEHEDHFCLENVTEAFRKNPELRVISTKKVTERLQKAQGCNKNIYMISPDETGVIQIDIQGYSLALFNSAHMGEQYKNIQNLVCMIECNGKQIVVTGDAWPKPELFERISKWASQIDLLVVPFPVVGIPSNRRNIIKYLEVLGILAVHLPRIERDKEGWYERARSICENTADGLPKAVFGGALGKIYTISGKIEDS